MNKGNGDSQTNLADLLLPVFFQNTYNIKQINTKQLTQSFNSSTYHSLWKYMVRKLKGFNDLSYCQHNSYLS